MYLRNKNGKIMIYKIEKGDKFLCKKSFKMDCGRIDYKRGKIYTSENTHCITDNEGYSYHEMDCLPAVVFFEHFKII